VPSLFFSSSAADGFKRSEPTCFPLAALSSPPFSPFSGRGASEERRGGEAMLLFFPFFLFLPPPSKEAEMYGGKRKRVEIDRATVDPSFSFPIPPAALDV